MKIKELKNVDNLVEGINKLLGDKERGEHTYYEWNGHVFFSDDVIMDDALTKCLGYNKLAFDKIKEAEKVKNDLAGKIYELEMELSERKGPIDDLIIKKRILENKLKETEQEKNKLIGRIYNLKTKLSEKKETIDDLMIKKRILENKLSKLLVEKSRKNIDEVKITKEMIVNGLKFIAENPYICQEELVKGLLELGCNFTKKELKEQLHTDALINDGVKSGDLYWGAYIIMSMRDGAYGRKYVTRKFIRKDKPISIYNLIRFLTGDESYTFENIYKNSIPLVRTRTNHS